MVIEFLCNFSDFKMSVDIRFTEAGRLMLVAAGYNLPALSHDQSSSQTVEEGMEGPKYGRRDGGPGRRGQIRGLRPEARWSPGRDSGWSSNGKVSGGGWS